MPKPKLRIFAGPNGSGKSTLFKAISDIYFSTQIFINADILERQFKDQSFLDLKEFNINCTSVQFSEFYMAHGLYKKAGFTENYWNLTVVNNVIVKKEISSSSSYNSYHFAIIADFIRHVLIENGISFSFETVFSHSSKLELIDYAKKKGYKTYLYFIGTDTPIINLERIYDRVKKGGHPVAVEKIKDRYFKTMNLFYDMIKSVDESYIWDNSGFEHQFVASTKKKVLSFERLTVPNWIVEYLIDKMPNN